MRPIVRRVGFCVAVAGIFGIGGSLGFAQGNDIASFVSCLDNQLSIPATVDVSNTVQCIPNGCKLTVTMSQESAQPACFEQPQPTDTKVQLPRVILSCPGPAGNEWQRFRPSYLMCPTPIPERGGGWNRIEIGQDLQPSVVNKLATLNLQMADISIPFGQRWTKINDPTTTYSGACVSCHARTPGGTNQQFQPIDSYGTFTSTQLDNKNHVVLLRSYVINSTEPTKGPLVNNPPAPGTSPTTLAAICGIINGQATNANKPLCANLMAYQANRSCGNNGANQVCGGLTGGGMFKYDQLFVGNNSMSVIAFDVSGQATKNLGNNTYTFGDTEGSLTAYNYQSRKQVSSVKIQPASSLVVTVTPAGFLVTGSANAQVSTGGAAPVAVNISFSIAKTAAGLTFLILDNNSDFLAGGTAQTGASIVKTNLN